MMRNDVSLLNILFFVCAQDHDGMVPPLDRTWMIGVWPVDVYQIPIVIGISTGVLVLLLFIAVLIVWRCCHIHRLREKAFGNKIKARFYRY